MEGSVEVDLMAAVEAEGTEEVGAVVGVRAARVEAMVGEGAARRAAATAAVEMVAWKVAQVVELAVDSSEALRAAAEGMVVS